MEVIKTENKKNKTKQDRCHQWSTLIITPVANIVFCCFVFLDLKSGDGRTDNMCENNVPTGRDFGLAEWIENCILLTFSFLGAIHSLANFQNKKTFFVY